MKKKIRDLLKTSVVLLCSFAVIWFALLVAVNQAHGGENTLTGRQKLLDRISDSSTIILGLPGEEPSLIWRVKKTHVICPCDLITAPLGEGMSMTILSVGYDVKFIFLDYDSVIFATIRSSNGTPSSAELTNEQLAEFSDLAKKILDAAMERLQISSDEELEKVVKELLIAEGAIEI
ncbi:MAG: hypothetical protein UW30_C0003G0005 [Candidatus Giovannonibacteria bacterium GW2011_GWA2_44_13b]|uniref:Uncharacterized protein n=1 Tax=Candidatus Giovannonibacteria bacterium GW2011_GWA2_44_13b TaxID=1618647 RepID=A0A0G1H535_9BACT|nr:MAG: hypothetical protein UW30_C0003G0005 [Candidatus Giovannonibacteria bacterium GW2011_GWA2_44_13b]